jgi:hypothetical protein
MFATSIGGSCDVTLAAHDDSNGDVVRRTFTCTALASSMGDHVDVSFGELSTAINDASNDPSLDPPGP